MATTTLLAFKKRRFTPIIKLKYYEIILELGRLIAADEYAISDEEWDLHQW
jgi:hypothetical protein